MGVSGEVGANCESLHYHTARRTKTISSIAVPVIVATMIARSLGKGQCGQDGQSWRVSNRESHAAICCMTLYDCRRTVSIRGTARGIKHKLHSAPRHHNISMVMAMMTAANVRSGPPSRAAARREEAFDRTMCSSL